MNPQQGSHLSDRTSSTVAGAAGAAPPERAVVVSEITHRYGERTALDSVSLTVAEGEIFGLLGPNGSGKTTLFKILTTLLRPTSGTATLFSSDLARDPAGVRRLLGVAFQSPSLDGKLTCLENLVHHGHLYGLRGPSLATRSLEMLERFGLADRRGDQTEKLSGGLKRRLELAKAILHRPRLLILDEPATGLDPGARQDVWRDLFALRQDERITVVLTTHLMDEAERCDRLAILNGGRVVAEGSGDELKAEIGGDVISVETSDPEKLALDIASRFSLSTQCVEGSVRIEMPDAHKFVATLIEAFPGAVLSVRLGKPTLEDVFLHHTGKPFDGSAEVAA
jgi:ABC-2 type transport system ATP-binding protein